MPTTMNKQRLLTQLFTVLKKKYEPGDHEPRPVLEQFIYAICREGATREQADQAFRALRERFFDWNEIRVTSSRELGDVLADLSQPEVRAERLISFLQEVFETTFSFDLEWLHKKGLKQAAKQLARYQSASDFVVSWVVQNTLGGHAIPIDPPTLRSLRRLGLIEGNEGDSEALRTSLEHLVPKARGPLFADILSALADDVCVDRDPNCACCPLAAECPTGQEASRSAVAGARGRSKPR